VFDAAWFTRHQATLLRLLATPLIGRWFRWVLGIRPSDVGHRGRIVRLDPHAYTVANLDGTLTTDFRTHAKYAKRLYFAFRPLWWTLHAWDLLVDPWLPRVSFGFAVLTAFPDPGNSGPSTCDGLCKRFTEAEAWSTIRNGVGNGADTTSQTAMAYVYSSYNPGTYREIWRAATLFNTSSLGAAFITSASVSLYAVSITNQFLDSPTYDACASAPASNTNLVSSDYQTFGTTSFGSLAGSGINVYYTCALNGSGVSNIAKTGISKFGFRVSWDRTGVEPTWADSKQAYFSFQTADYTGTAQDPKLDVTYSTAPPSDMTLAMILPYTL
jgi:hypothetical protein